MKKMNAAAVAIVTVSAITMVGITWYSNKISKKNAADISEIREMMNEKSPYADIPENL